MHLANDHDLWRRRAQAVRQLAETETDPSARQMLLTIAGEYEHFAELAEERRRRPTVHRAARRSANGHA